MELDGIRKAHRAKDLDEVVIEKIETVSKVFVDHVVLIERKTVAISVSMTENEREKRKKDQEKDKLKVLSKTDFITNGRLRADNTHGITERDVVPATDEIERVGDKAEGSSSEINVAKTFLLDKEFRVGKFDIADAKVMISRAI